MVISETIQSYDKGNEASSSHRYFGSCSYLLWNAEERETL